MEQRQRGLARRRLLLAHGGISRQLSDSGVRLPKAAWPDRRASIRFPVTLDIRYSVSHRPAETGSGQIIDLSSSGLRFAAQGPLEPGLKLDVAINWPVRLDGRVQLQLILTGTVVWSSETEIALRIQRHDFRTRRVGLKAASPQESDSLSLAGVKAVDAHTVGSGGTSKQ
jgi:PilZ domain